MRVETHTTQGKVTRVRERERERVPGYHAHSTHVSLSLIYSVVSTEAPVSAFYSFSVARGACAQTVLFLIADALPKHPKAGKDLHCGAYCGAAPCLPVDRPQQVQASSPSRPPGPAELQKWHVPASMHSAPARQGAARPRRSTSTAAFTSSCWRAWCASACGRASPPAWA